MPACFQLSLKSSKEFLPVPLNTIDSVLCVAYGCPVDDKRYFAEWFNIIGYAVACGKSLQDIKKSILDAQFDPENEQDKRIRFAAEFLEETYVSDAFYQSK